MEPDRSGGDINLDDAYISISTEPSAAAWNPSAESIISNATESRREAIQLASRSGVQESTSSKKDPLARAVSRRGRPLSSVLWTDEFLSQTTTTGLSVDLSFEQRIRRGITRIVPGPPAWTHTGMSRAIGSLHAVKIAKSSPSLAADENGHQLRHSHLQRTVTGIPVLTFAGIEDNSSARHVYVYHNAIRAELENLYAITSSIQKRKHDIQRDDVVAFYAWVSVFGDFVRLYFCAFERFVLNAIEISSDMELYENMSSNRRKRSKLNIVRTLEELEALKRPMQANPDADNKAFQKILMLSDKFALELLKYIGDEIEQIPSMLTTYFHSSDIQDMFRQVDEYLEATPSGTLHQVILCFGSGVGVQAQKAWLKKQVQMLKGQKTFRSATLVSQRWMKRFYDVHTQYVRGFKKAEKEYIHIFG